MSDTRWLAAYPEEGAPAFRIGTGGDELVAEWPSLARLIARRDGSTWRFEPSNGAPSELVEKVRLGGVVALLRHLRGELALHGAAVGVGGRAIVLLGRSGQGKSTLAAAMCAHANGALLADDVVAVAEEARGNWTIEPTEQHHFLATDGTNAKRRILAARREPRPLPLAAVVDLAFDEDLVTPRLVRTGSLEAVGALVPQVVRFVLDEPARHARELETLVRLVSDVPFYRLLRPRDLGLLEEVAAMISGLMENGEGTVA